MSDAVPPPEPAVLLDDVLLALAKDAKKTARANVRTYA